MASEQIEAIEPMAQAKDYAALYEGSIDAVMAANRALIDGVQAVGAETLAFWQSRLKEGFATGNRLSECGSPQDAVEIQLEYVKAAWQAYLDQGNKVAGLVVRATIDGAAPRAARPRPRARLAIESAA